MKDSPNLENTRAFVEYETRSYKPISKERLYVFVVAGVVFSALGVVFGVFNGGLTLVFGVLIVVATGVYSETLYLCLKDKRAVHEERLLRNSVGGTFLTVLFFLFTLLHASLSPRGDLICVSVVLAFSGVLLVGLLVVLRLIHTGYFLKKRGKKGREFSISASVVLGMFMGNWLIRTQSEEVISIIAVTCSFMAAVFFAYRLLDFLKLYYVVKYKLVIQKEV